LRLLAPQLPSKQVHRLFRTSQSSASSAATEPTVRGSRRGTRVRFAAAVTVRSYPSVLSDHPCVSRGPPVGLAWHFTEARWVLPSARPALANDAALFECRRLAAAVTGSSGRSKHEWRTHFFAFPGRAVEAVPGQRRHC